MLKLILRQAGVSGNGSFSLAMTALERQLSCGLLPWVCAMKGVPPDYPESYMENGLEVVKM
jgi:hypothetical protein